MSIDSAINNNAHSKYVHHKMYGILQKISTVAVYLECSNAMF